MLGCLLHLLVSQVELVALGPWVKASDSVRSHVTLLSTTAGVRCDVGQQKCCLGHGNPEMINGQGRAWI